jgi:malate synthase
MAMLKGELLVRDAVEIVGRDLPQAGEILSGEAIAFVGMLAREFEGRRQELLRARVVRQAALDRGQLPDFLLETAEIRQGAWRIGPIPADLQQRRVEITGPIDRKMIINALNSGADVFMADCEDANSPTWENVVEGQFNLRDAVRGTIEYSSPEGKRYRLNERTAVLFFRPRGWHLNEKHVLVDGKPISASLFDFGLYFYHNARALMAKGSGPYFYLPKMESHLEARLWNDVFVRAQAALDIPQGTIKATVLIETILAAFEMDEILYELREHSAGLNCGRWDYIFSFIKKFRNRPDFVLPDRALVTMTTHFLRSYSRLAIKTCHRRGAHAMGGMAAQIPIKQDPAANAEAMQKVRGDKQREVGDGHDGTWVAHPGLVPIAMEIFATMAGPNQIERQLDELTVTAADLLAVPRGPITEAGLRTNISIGIQYLEAWLRGLGCVPLYNLMEDAATAEISRAQVWQWLHHGVKLADGRQVTRALIERLVGEELDKIRAERGADAFEQGKFGPASEIFARIAMADEFTDFLTLPAYEALA